MEEGPHPDFKMPMRWLYLGDDPVLHLTIGGANVSKNRRKYLGQQSTATKGSGVVDHVAFRATGLEGMLAHLDAKGVEYKKRQVNDQELLQLFLMDPNEVRVELNFEASEAKGLIAEVRTVELAD